MTLKLNRVREVVKFVQNIIKLSIAVHHLSCQQPISQWWKIEKSGPVTLTLKFSGFRAVINEHVHAEFHPAKCSGYWLILRTEKTMPKTLQSVATAWTITRNLS